MADVIAAANITWVGYTNEASTPVSVEDGIHDPRNCPVDTDNRQWQEVLIWDAVPGNDIEAFVVPDPGDESNDTVNLDYSLQPGQVDNAFAHLLFRIIKGQTVPGSVPGLSWSTFYTSYMANFMRWNDGVDPNG